MLHPLANACPEHAHHSPCNQFGAQEPGEPEDIKAFVYGEPSHMSLSLDDPLFPEHS